MDPKNLPNLDPKLREVYERVMGTNLTPPQSVTTPQVTPPISPLPVPPVFPAPISPTPLPMPTAAAPIQTSTPPIAHTQTVPNPFVKPISQVPSIVPPSQTTIKNQPPTKGISPVIVGLAALVFFLVYAVFWVKFFNFKLPFMAL